ncbi:hypothetical protein N7470_009417 [Penicillium chermesinum]|nr:hypothetical protein N7470_009417 [Penicillium chermesinum]
MSSSNGDQPFGSQDRQQGPFGRKSSATSYSLSLTDYRSSLDVSPITPFSPATLDHSTYPPIRSGLESQTRSASTNHFPPGDPSNDRTGSESPDPDSFYRQGGSLGASTPKLGSGSDDVTARPGNSMASGPSHIHNRSSRMLANVQELSHPQGPIRSVSDTSSTSRPSIKTTRSPTIKTKPSIQDLVNKFNNNPDPVLPVPAGSRPASITDSPVDTTQPFDRNLPLPRQRTLPEFSSQRPLANNVARSESIRPESQPGPFDTVPLPLFQRTSDSYAPRPLFGELLTVNTQVNNPGLGIPSTQPRRRGSDGSIPSPNPAFLDHSDPNSARTPLTPTAWYLGQTSSLEAIQLPFDTNSSGHRRARSDFPTPLGGPLAEAWNPDMAVPAPLRLMKTGDGPESPNSRSRIPISSHRRSSASGSPPVSPSAKSSFSNRSTSVGFPPKGSSRLPKPAGASPPRTAGNSPSNSTPRGSGVLNNGRTHLSLHERSRQLEAVISNAPSKRSPPLRSSRPRQTVSNNTITSRPRIGDRVSSLQKAADREASRTGGQRPRSQVPEIGTVDFATRRQRIQQAFNRTVQENERKAEEAAELRRRTQIKVKADAGPPTNGQDTPESSQMATTVTVSTEIQNRDGLDPHQIPQLQLNTEALDKKSEKKIGEEQNENAVPQSAVTADSFDDQITTIDPEPQLEIVPRNAAVSHRALLSQIMHIRESSSSADSCDDNDCSLSEADDHKVPVEVMLGGTTYFHSPPDDGGSKSARQQDSKDKARWSTGSWSSSVHQNHETIEEECDEDDDSGDDLILQMPTPAHEGAPTIETCSVSSSTRPSSVIEDEEPTRYWYYGTRYSSRYAKSHQKPVLHPTESSKQGKWDSRRVTQLYLEQLTRGRHANVGLPTSNPSIGPSNANARSRPPPRSYTPLEQRPAVPDTLQEEPSVALPPSGENRASLFQPGDWEDASPSMLDWMQYAADDTASTPVEEKQTYMPEAASVPKVMEPVAELDATHGQKYGLGLSNARSPIDTLSTVAELATASVYTDVEPDISRDPGIRPTARGQGHSVASSEDSSLRQAGPSHSPNPADSSATSLAVSADQSRTDTKKSPSPEQQRLRKRRHIIKELVDTETAFGRDMKVVEDIYKGTSGSCLDLSAEDVKILFGNSDQLVQFSLAFSEALKHAAQTVYIEQKARWGSRRNARPQDNQSGGNEQISHNGGPDDYENDRATSIGDAFVLNMGQMEKIYSDYLRNHDAANKKLLSLQKNPKVAIWLKECREWASDLTTAWDLDSLLVKPVQRITKYPLLLTELLQATPEDHPDHANLLKASQEVRKVSTRINDMKKRADVVGQIVSRKRNQSDVRSGLSKAFGRRTEKLRQQVGMSDMVEDKEYDSLSQRFSDGFFQLQVVMRDVEMYTRETQRAMDQLNDFVVAIDNMINVAQSNYPELESKWREFKVSMREIFTVVLPEHLEVVRRSVIQPMISLLKLHEGPQRIMKKRDKRLLDYARYKALAERGDKPDKKTTEQGEQFIALNDTLKDELPRLYSLTAKLMETCLMNFIQIQTRWWNTFQRRVHAHVDDFPQDLEKIIRDWNSDYTFSEAQVLSLGICNGSLLADAVNLVNFNTPSEGRRSSTVTSSNRPPSLVEPEPPKLSQEFGTGMSQLFSSPKRSSFPRRESQSNASRRRANSAMSNGDAPSPATPETSRTSIFGSQPRSRMSAGENNQASRQSAGTFSGLPRLSLDAPLLAEILHATSNENETAPLSPSRYSGFFSSAMPMSDGANESRPSNAEPPAPAPAEPRHDPKVLFLAASIYEFNIDRARREAGYPYLTYVAGEIFDVIGEKGELWLARNQDDPTSQVGWIWNKHFAKLSS